MNLKNYLSLQELKDLKLEANKIFFWRICGTGMGACATLFKELGFEVEGVDRKFYPPMGPYLKSMGIKLHNIDEVDKEYLSNFDLIVVGNVVSGKSDEARYIEQLDIPFTSFPSALGAFVLEDKEVIGVAGTHGKTTTTYYGTQVFEKLGLNPGYFVGGVIEGGPSSKLGDKLFIIESDEYDSGYFQKESKFHSYMINHLILTSLEFDHADIYESQEAINKEFRRLIPRINGMRIFCSDYPEIDKVVKDKSELIPYGNQFIDILSQGADGSAFVLKFENKHYEFKTNIIGKHNIHNLSSIILFCLKKGFELEAIQNAVKRLENVKRRQELRGKYQEALIIDDFAHHPTAVKETISSIKLTYPDKKVLTVFEPASATARSSKFQLEFAESLSLSDQVLVLQPPSKTTVEGFESIDSDKLSSSSGGKLISNLDELITSINDFTAKPDSLVLILSNGTCMGLWESEFVKEIH